MKTSIKKRLKILALGLGLTMGGALKAQAAISDQLTVTITPNAYYAVVIDTTNVVLNLGTVALSASTQTVRPSTVTVQSTYATTDLRVQGSISSGGTPWTFDANTASSEADAIAAWATFTSIGRSSAPTQTSDYFSGTVPGASGSDAVDTTNRYVGTSAGGTITGAFESTTAGFDLQDMDALVPNTASHLWLYFRLPSATTSNAAQNISFTITAVAPTN